MEVKELEKLDETVKEVNVFIQYVTDHIPAMIGFGIRVCTSILFFIVGRIVIRWVRKIVKTAMEKAGMDKGVTQFTDSLVKFGLYVLLIFTIATKYGLDATSVAAMIASAGLAVGLALQGSLSNFAGGVLILLLKPFLVGDYIIEDNHKNEGTVKEIKLFYTKLTTVDNKTIVIPNSMLTNNSLTNVTAKDERRLDFTVDISYDADLKEAKRILEDLLRNDERVIKEKELLVFVDALAESAVVIGARAWVTKEEYWTVKWDILEKVKLAFDEAGIEIPYRKLDVKVRS